MDMPMNPPWYMGRLEWLEVALFVVLSAVILALLTQCRRRRKAELEAVTVAEPEPSPAEHRGGWRTIPEVQLLILALPLELLWEVAQFPLFTVWHEGDWGYILYGLAHCTLGDLLILLAAYWLVALLNRDRRWYQNSVLANGFLFTLLGAVYTVYSELTNVRIKATWDYTELMPLIPLVEIGAMPFLQWVLIPPVLLWLMRLLTFSTLRTA